MSDTLPVAPACNPQPPEAHLSTVFFAGTGGSEVELGHALYTFVAHLCP